MATQLSSPTTHAPIRSARDLGALLRRARKAEGLTQAEAAALAGVGVRFLSELERGKETAELGLVLRVCTRFGLDVVVLPRGHVVFVRERGRALDEGDAR